MNWEQLCNLVHKHVAANQAILGKKEVQVNLLRYHIRRNRECVPITNSNHAALAAAQSDREKAETLVSTTPVKELHKELLSIIEMCFNGAKEENDRDLIDLAMECSQLLLETRVMNNGSCCIIEEESPYVVGYYGGGLCRGETCAPVTLPSEEVMKKLSDMFDLIDQVPQLLIVMNGCDSCT